MAQIPNNSSDSVLNKINELIDCDEKVYTKDVYKSLNIIERINFPEKELSKFQLKLMKKFIKNAKEINYDKRIFFKIGDSYPHGTMYAYPTHDANGKAYMHRNFYYDRCLYHINTDTNSHMCRKFSSVKKFLKKAPERELIERKAEIKKRFFNRFHDAQLFLFKWNKNVTKDSELIDFVKTRLNIYVAESCHHEEKLDLIFGIIKTLRKFPHSHFYEWDCKYFSRWTEEDPLPKPIDTWEHAERLLEGLHLYPSGDPENFEKFKKYPS